MSVISLRSLLRESKNSKLRDFGIYCPALPFTEEIGRDFFFFISRPSSLDQ